MFKVLRSKYLTDAFNRKHYNIYTGSGVSETRVVQLCKGCKSLC